MSGVEGFFSGGGVGGGHRHCRKASFFCHLNRINEKIIMITKQTVVVVALVAGKTDWIEAAAATWGGGGACLWWDDYRVKGHAGATTGTIREPCDNQNQTRTKKKQKTSQTVGKSDVSACWNVLEPLDTHRKAIDCRSSAVHVDYIYYY